MAEDKIKVLITNIEKQRQEYAESFVVAMRNSLEQGYEALHEQAKELCETTGYDYETCMYIVRTARGNNIMVEDIKRVYAGMYSITKALEEFKKEAMKIADVFKDLQQCFDENKDEIEDAKEIANLERQRKRCKNYLELKQIDRRLNDLKRHRGKHKK